MSNKFGTYKLISDKFLKLNEHVILCKVKDRSVCVLADRVIEYERGYFMHSCNTTMVFMGSEGLTVLDLHSGKVLMEGRAEIGRAMSGLRNVLKLREAGMNHTGYEEISPESKRDNWGYSTQEKQEVDRVVCIDKALMLKNLDGKDVMWDIPNITGIPAESNSNKSIYKWKRYGTPLIVADHETPSTAMIKSCYPDCCVYYAISDGGLRVAMSLGKALNEEIKSTPSNRMVTVATVGKTHRKYESYVKKHTADGGKFEYRYNIADSILKEEAINIYYDMKSKGLIEQQYGGVDIQIKDRLAYGIVSDAVTDIEGDSSARLDLLRGTERNLLDEMKANGARRRK